MKKLNRLIGTAAAAAALLLTVAACSNSFTPQTPPEQAQNGGGSYSQEALATPLTLEACDAGAVVTFDNKAAGPVTYKVNGETAQTIASGDSANITLAKVGDKVEFFGDNKAYATSASNYSNITCDKDCNVYGNIMSLIKSEGFEKATALENVYTFAYFFRDNAHIKNKSGAPLLLPATTLASNCYQYMFDGRAKPFRHHAGELLLPMHVRRLYKPDSRAKPSRNHAGGKLLRQHVPRLHKPDSRAKPSRNHAGEKLLRQHVIRLRESDSRAKPSRNHAGGRLLLLHVPRLRASDGRAKPSRNHAGEKLLQRHVRALREPCKRNLPCD